MQRNILKKVLMCGISLLLILLIFTPANGLHAAEDAVETNVELDESISGTYFVNAQNGLKMRSAPSTDADVVALLPYKAEITVTGAATDSWYKVEYSNQSGYVAATYVTKSSVADAETKDTQTTETQESTTLSETSSEDTTNTFGATSVITALIAAIIIMAILALFTAYSFLKKGNNDATEEYDEEYDDDEEEYDNYSNNDDEHKEYDDDEYDDDEYDDDEEE